MFTSAAKSLLRRAQTKLIIADVGCAGGFHSRIKEMRSESYIFGFDADPIECARLNELGKPGEKHINAAIGRDGEKITVELHAKRETSSIYPSAMNRLENYPEAGRFLTEKTISFTTRSLDNVCKDENIPRLDYIKLDIEGHELAALEGYAGPLLMAEVEVTFHPYRKGVPLFNEIMAHMTSRGFLLIDLRRTCWHPKVGKSIKGLSTKGFVIFGDALFVMDPFQKENLQKLSTVEIRARYLALLCMYGYAAEALMVIDLLKNAQLMDENEYRETGNIIRTTCAQSNRVKVKGFGLMFSIIEKWVKLPFSIRSGFFVGEWSQVDREVGNWPYRR